MGEHDTQQRGYDEALWPVRHTKRLRYAQNNNAYGQMKE